MFAIMLRKQNTVFFKTIYGQESKSKVQKSEGLFDMKSSKYPILVQFKATSKYLSFIKVGYGEYVNSKSVGFQS